MSEKPPRRQKGDGLPSEEHNPDLERLIASAAPKPSETVSPGKPSEREKEVVVEPSVMGGKDLENLLAKISAEKNLTRQDAHDIFQKIGGKNASPEALEATTKLIAGKLSGEAYNDYLEEVGSVYPLNVSPVAETTPGLDVIRKKLEQLGDARLAGAGEQAPAVSAPESVPPASTPPPSVVVEGSFQVRVAPSEASPAAEKLPGANPEDVKAFEEKFPTKEVAPVVSEIVPETEEGEGQLVTLDKKASFSEAQKARFAEIAEDLTPLEARLHLNELLKGARKRIKKTLSPLAGRKQSGKKKKTEADAVPTVESPEVLREDVASRARGVSSADTSDRVPSAMDVAMKRTEHVPQETSEEPKGQERMSERGERAKAWLSKRSEELQKSAEKYGPKALKVIEGYNKLNWKTKLAITGGLMLGAGLSVSAGPLVSGAFGAALWGQRALAGLGTIVNKRKGIDAKIKRDPRSWWANRSEFTKDAYATALALVWTMGSSFVVHEGVEALKVVGQSDAFKEGWEAAKNTVQEGAKKAGDLANEGWSQRNALHQWLGEMLDHAPSQGVVEGVASNTTPNSLPTSTPGAVEEVLSQTTTLDSPPTPEAEAAALAYTPSDIPPEPEVVLPPHYSGQYLQETYDKFAWFDRTPEQIRALAHDSLIPDLTPEHQGLIDNHISSLSPAERASFLQYVEELKTNPSASVPTGAYPAAQVDLGIKNLKEHLDTMQELTKEPANVSNAVSGAPIVETAVPTVPAPPAAESVQPPQVEVPPAPSPEYQENLIRSHVKGLNDEWSKLYDERAQVRTDIATAQAEGSTATLQELSAKEAHIEQQMSDIKQSAEKAGIDMPYGRDPLDGHPMSAQEAKSLEELRKSMHDPRPLPEKTLFEKISGWFGGDSNATEAVNVPDQIVNEAGISISTRVPGIYADSGGNILAYGGSIQERIDAVQKFLTENPGRIVFNADDSGKYRVPWGLYNGQVIPIGEPVRTSGFLGFGGSYMDAPKPEEFVKIIK